MNLPYKLTGIFARKIDEAEVPLELKDTKLKRMYNVALGFTNYDFFYELIWINKDYSVDDKDVYYAKCLIKRGELLDLAMDCRSNSYDKGKYRNVIFHEKGFKFSDNDVWYDCDINIFFNILKVLKTNRTTFEQKMNQYKFVGWH